MDFEELDEEDKLLLVKLRIKKRVEKHTRTQARYLMGIFAIVIMFFGTVITPPMDVIVMIIILIFCFGLVPVATVISMYAVIQYRTNAEFDKYLEGRDLNERQQ